MIRVALGQEQALPGTIMWSFKEKENTERKGRKYSACPAEVEQGRKRGGNIWSVIGEGEHYDMVNMHDGLIWVDRSRDIQTTKHIIL